MGHILKTQKQIDEFCYGLCDKGVEVIACDVETTEFNKDRWIPQQLDLYGIGIYASENDKAYIVYNKRLKYDSLDFLFHSVQAVVFHNAKFDLTVLRSHNLMTFEDEISVHDTMLMSYIDDESRFSHGLKQLAKGLLKVENVTKYDDVGDKPVKEESNQQTIFEALDPKFIEKEYRQKVKQWEDKMGAYCIDDCKHTLKLFEYFGPRLSKHPELLKIYMDMELPVMKVLMDMEWRGVQVDVKYLKELDGKAEKKLVNLTSEIYKLNDGKKFDINSPKQLSKILFQDKGYIMPDEYRTPKGDPSTDSKALQYLVDTEESELAAAVLQYRELSKLQSAFITAIPKLAVNGVIHANFRQTQTSTGRLSCSTPNLQQLPRRADEFNIRAAFKPRKGYIFVQCDWSQIEVRIMASLCQEPTMLKAYSEGKDLYQEIADNLDISRHESKSVLLGINYGRSAYGLSKGLGISPEEAEEYIARYFEKFPNVKNFLDSAILEVEKKKYVTTITHRRRMFNNYNKLKLVPGKTWAEMDSEEKYEAKNERERVNRAIRRMACNAKIQGSSADILKIAARNIVKAYKDENIDAHILLQIHDEFIVECREDQKERGMELLQWHMENAVQLPGVKLVAEPKFMTEWEK